MPNRHIHTTLPADLAARLELYLYSEAERRVPKAAWQAFIVERIVEFFGRESLDLAPYMPHLPPGSLVWGPKPLIQELKEKLSVHA